MHLMGNNNIWAREFAAQLGEDQSDDECSDHTTWSHMVKVGLNYAF